MEKERCFPSKTTSHKKKENVFISFPSTNFHVIPLYNSVIWYTCGIVSLSLFCRRHCQEICSLVRSRWNEIVKNNSLFSNNTPKLIWFQHFEETFFMLALVCELLNVWKFLERVKKLSQQHMNIRWNAKSAIKNSQNTFTFFFTLLAEWRALDSIPLNFPSPLFSVPQFYLLKALFDSSYALKLNKTLLVSIGTRKCCIDTSL